MKRILMALGLVFTLGATEAMAMGKQATFEVGYSTMVHIGVICTTGTAVNITAAPNYPSNGAKGPWAGFLIQNQDSADTVWFGNETVNAAAGAGFKLLPGSDWSVNLGRWKDSTTSFTPLWCEADSAAGAAGAQLTVVWFGY